MQWGTEAEVLVGADLCVVVHVESGLGIVTVSREHQLVTREFGQENFHFWAFTTLLSDINQSYSYD